VTEVRTRKKLIEVALPLDAINSASAREKSIRHGHPSTLHLWWARRPLAAARAVIFAQMVDDPSAVPEEFPTEAEQEAERQRLFHIIEGLVLWENTTNETVLEAARAEIRRCWQRACADNADHPRAAELFDPDQLPAFHDPFAGGGALPLEAQRLGLESYASDLNPVAVLINKAMIEIPPKFAGRPPTNPQVRKDRNLFTREWNGAQGLAEDVRYYGQWMRDEAERRIGHLYPKVEVTDDMAKERPDLKPYVDRKLTVIAWLWARTVKSPNPAFAHIDVPLAATFVLSSKPGKQAHVEPVVDNGSYAFTVRVGKPKDVAATKSGTKLSRGSFACLMSGTPISGEHIKAEGMAGRMGARLMAIVAEGDRGRVYLTPTSEQEAAALEATPTWKPEGEIPKRMTGGNCTPYGLTAWGDLFTPRQLVALTTFSNLVQETRERVQRDAMVAGLADDTKPLGAGGAGSTAYAEAVGVYLGLAVARYSNASTTVCSWNPGEKKEDIRFTFSRQALPMTWDYAEGNPFSASSGNYSDNIETWLYKVLLFLPGASLGGTAVQADAASQAISSEKVISTDPPYYDNIGYADLSDFFYVWQRRSLKPLLPELFTTLAVPKAQELVAAPYRHGSKEEAEAFFLDGMTHAMHRLAEQAHPAFPVTIYYAFKQSESDDTEGAASTGWQTFLDAVIRAGFSVSGTWPIRTERQGRSIGIGTNALASSIVLVCRPRNAAAQTATRREFVSALKAELPLALARLQHGNIAPVDLAQAAIGPGMAVYTRYATVLDAGGTALSVRDALSLINRTLDEALAEQEGDFDADSRWALTWFDQLGYAEGEYGLAETLATARNTSVRGLVEAGIALSARGKVRLLAPHELSMEWDPTTDRRLTHWDAVHHLIRVLGSDGEPAAAQLVKKLGGKAETARELAYRLYTVCERKSRAKEALSYNGLVQSWPEMLRLSRVERRDTTRDTPLFGEA
jgi:putative DNA methylase